MLVKVPVENPEDPRCVALIDEEDAIAVFAYDWHAEWDYQAKKTVAVSRKNLGGGESQATMMHHLIRPPRGGAVPVHADGNGLNNLRKNLVLVHRSTATKPAKTTSSRFKGVTFDKRTKKWQAQIRMNGRLVHIGRFTVEADAARAYDVAARDYHGDRASLNFPGGTNA